MFFGIISAVVITLLTVGVVQYSIGRWLGQSRHRLPSGACSITFTSKSPNTTGMICLVSETIVTLLVGGFIFDQHIGIHAEITTILLGWLTASVLLSGVLISHGVHTTTVSYTAGDNSVV